MCMWVYLCVAKVLSSFDGGRLSAVYFGTGACMCVHARGRLDVRVSFRLCMSCLGIGCKRASNSNKILPQQSKLYTKYTAFTRICIVVSLLFFTRLWVYLSLFSKVWFRFVSFYFNCIVFISEVVGKNAELETFHRRFCTQTSRKCALHQMNTKNNNTHSSITAISPQNDIRLAHAASISNIFGIHFARIWLYSSIFPLLFCALLRWSSREKIVESQMYVIFGFRFRYRTKWFMLHQTIALTHNHLKWIESTAQKLEFKMIIKNTFESQTFAFSSFHSKKTENIITAELICGRNTIVWHGRTRPFPQKCELFALITRDGEKNQSKTA